MSVNLFRFNLQIFLNNFLYTNVKLFQTKMFGSMKRFIAILSSSWSQTENASESSMPQDTNDKSCDSPLFHFTYLSIYPVINLAMGVVAYTSLRQQVDSHNIPILIHSSVNETLDTFITQISRAVFCRATFERGAARLIGLRPLKLLSVRVHEFIRQFLRFHSSAKCNDSSASLINSMTDGVR